MARNVEIKARISDVDALLPVAQGVAQARGSDGAPTLIEQDDVFFAVPHGRLKLRRLADGSAELIHYVRPDGTQARLSDYVRVAVPDAEAMHQALRRACGEAGRVRKRRWLVWVGQTRIHLDRVAGLGDFIELEVVLDPAQTEAEGVAIAGQLMTDLGLADAPRVAGAYLDQLVGPFVEPFGAHG
jgi:adenylate cyclase class IV